MCTRSPDVQDRLSTPRQYHRPIKPCTCQQPLARTATPARPRPVHPIVPPSKKPAHARATKRTVKGRRRAFKERPLGLASPAPRETARGGAKPEWAWPQRQ